MDELERLAEIKKKSKDPSMAEDIHYLIGLVEEKNKKLQDLEKKNNVLSTHVLELTQEMENTKADFGGSR